MPERHLQKKLWHVTFEESNVIAYDFIWHVLYENKHFHQNAGCFLWVYTKHNGIQKNSFVIIKRSKGKKRETLLFNSWFWACMTQYFYFYLLTHVCPNKDNWEFFYWTRSLRKSWLKLPPMIKSLRKFTAYLQPLLQNTMSRLIMAITFPWRRVAAWLTNFVFWISVSISSIADICKLQLRQSVRRTMRGKPN